MSTAEALKARMQDQKAIKALLRELKGLRPGLDQPHPHKGVMREKVDNAIRLGEIAIEDTTPQLTRTEYASHTGSSPLLDIELTALRQYTIPHAMAIVRAQAVEQNWDPIEIGLMLQKAFSPSIDVFLDNMQDHCVE